VLRALMRYATRLWARTAPSYLMLVGFSFLARTAAFLLNASFSFYLVSPLVLFFIFLFPYISFCLPIFLILPCRVILSGEVMG
jgi:hypothetical protein